MHRILKHRPSPSMLVALVALFVALGGGAYAAISLPKNSVGKQQLRKNAVTSSKVKNHSLLAKDFKAGQLPAGSQGPAGAQGPAGPAGATGPEGPSHAYSTGFQTDVPLEENGTQHTLMSLTVPAGSYVVSARLQGTTVTDPDGPPGNSYRYDCGLDGGSVAIDDESSLWPRVGSTPGVESYLVYMGAFTGDGPITFSCSAGNGHPLTAMSGRMTAIKVGGLN